jgi:ribosomal protein S6--L-glutamate ligase
VLKPISGRQGTGLYCLPPTAAIPPDIEVQLTSGSGVLVIGKAVAGAITLKPPQGDFRTNAHIGGQAAPVELSAALTGLAVQAAVAMALEIAGVDLIVPKDGEPVVIEANSAPGFRVLEAATGKDIAGLMIDYVLSVCKTQGR